MKLNTHILKLIDRDCDNQGWASVSNALYPHLKKSMPKELIELSGDEGSYKAKLTEEGQSVVDALKWL